jgi:DNA-binding LacI/PurR family transcriptional regulator
MAVTLQTIADQLGLTRATVSYALGKQPHKVHPETRKRIEQVAKQLGYRPNRAARMMSQGRFGCVALLQGGATFQHSLPGEMLAGIHQGLAGHDLHLVVDYLSDDAFLSASLPRLFEQVSVDGFLIHYTHGAPPALAQRIADEGLPAIWLNTVQDCDAIAPDDRQGAVLACTCALEQGHRRIAWYDPFAGPSNEQHASVGLRRQGYLDAMAAAGLKPLLLPVGPQGPDEALASAFAGERAPTAVIAYSDSYNVVHHIKLSGRRIPDDCSVITFDPYAAPILGIACHHVPPPMHALGLAAVAMLQKKMAAPSQGLPSQYLPMHLIPGQSLDRPKSEDLKEFT